MCRLRRWIREGRGLLFILLVGAGQSLPVLPQVFFPRGNHENFDKALRDLAPSRQSPHSVAPVRSRDCRTRLMACRNGCPFPLKAHQSSRMAD